VAKTYSSNQWNASERSALTVFQDVAEKLIRAPLNGHSQKNGDFDLYYFVHTARRGLTPKSVLFCAGGPGEIVRTCDLQRTYADFLHLYDYNVVYFHLRGTGFSQVPAENGKDKFLRSTFAVADMEAIRKDFLGKNNQWEAIIGWSFGTILAQLYASRYSQFVKKLILISPLSRHMFKQTSKTAYDDYYRATLEIYRKSLDRIFSSTNMDLATEFGGLTAGEKNTILDKLFNFDEGILRKTEQVFGSIQSVIDAYREIKPQEFERSGLQKYSRGFYQSLRDLRIVGANSLDDDGNTINQQHLIGKTLRDELLPSRAPKPADPKPNPFDQGSQRAYYSFGIQDGLNWLFLRERFDRKNTVKGSLNALSGTSDSTGRKSIDKALDWNKRVKIDRTLKIKPWDPADHRHDVPTLILSGELDPVTAKGQADRYIKSTLTARKTRRVRSRVLFPTIGHKIAFGSIFAEDDQPPPQLSGAIQVNLPRVPPGAVVETTGTAIGLEFNPKFRIDLDKPEKLTDSIEILGCGIIQEKGDIIKSDQGDTLNIVALIKNKGNREIQIRDHKWRLQTPLLWGVVDFVKPTAIARTSICAIYGRLVHGGRDEKFAYHIEPMFPDKINRSLKFLGFNLTMSDDGTSNVELWFQNDSEELIPAEAGSPWVIRNAESPPFVFRIAFPEFKKKEIKSLSYIVDGLNFDATEALTINPPKELDGKLSACFPTKIANPERLSFVVWNRDKEEPQRVAKGWTVSSPVFSASIEIEPVTIEPNKTKTVVAEVRGINWVNCLNITKPRELNSKLQLLSYNIRDRNSVSILLKNKGDVSIDSPLLSWQYVDPTFDANANPLDRALNCLIFSFLVLRPSQFGNPNDNVMLQQIKKIFKNLSLELKIFPDLTKKVEKLTPNKRTSKIKLDKSFRDEVERRKFMKGDPR
jgi:pimeloyl-ACP methyl ester carboxylesterase